MTFLLSAAKSASANAAVERNSSRADSAVTDLKPELEPETSVVWRDDLPEVLASSASFALRFCRARPRPTFFLD